MSSTRAKQRQAGRSTRNKMVGASIASSGSKGKKTKKAAAGSEVPAGTARAVQPAYDIITGDPMQETAQRGGGNATLDYNQKLSVKTGLDHHGYTVYPTPLNPLTGEPMVDVSSYKEALNKTTTYTQNISAPKPVHGGAPAHLAAAKRGFGTGYPGHVESAEEHEARNLQQYTKPEQPTALQRNMNRGYDIINNQHMQPKSTQAPAPAIEGVAPGQTLSDSTQHDARTARPVNIISWQGKSKSKFGDDEWYEKDKLAGTAQRGLEKPLTGKVGLADGLARKIELVDETRRYNVNTKVGGERKEDFLRTEKARKEELRGGMELTNKPHQYYG